MTKTPKVSVLTPIYNTVPQYLRECIESILNQTFTDFEFLILNDSPENKEIEDIVQSYHDPRIKYYKNEKNMGISDSRNKLIDFSKGEYLAIFDHDDISLPTRLAEEVTVLDSHPEIGVVSGNFQSIPSFCSSKQPEENINIKIALMRTMAISHTHAMIRKSVLENYNIRYEKEFSPAEDYRLALRLIPFTMFYNIQSVVGYYRDDETNTSHKRREQMINADALCRCYAISQYPYLYQINSLTRQLCHEKWLKLFGSIPFIKIRVKHRNTKFFLFGFIPLFSLKTFAPQKYVEL